MAVTQVMRKRYRKRSKSQRANKMPVGTTSSAVSGYKTAQPKVCFQFASGNCKYGSECKFHHSCSDKNLVTEQSREEANRPPPTAIPAVTEEGFCAQLRFFGTYRNGSNCKFSHDSGGVNIKQVSNFSSPSPTLSLSASSSVTAPNGASSSFQCDTGQNVIQKVVMSRVLCREGDVIKFVLGFNPANAPEAAHVNIFIPTRMTTLQCWIPM